MWLEVSSYLHRKTCYNNTSGTHRLGYSELILYPALMYSPISGFLIRQESDVFFLPASLFPHPTQQHMPTLTVPHTPRAPNATSILLTQASHCKKHRHTVLVLYRAFEVWKCLSQAMWLTWGKTWGPRNPRKRATRVLVLTFRADLPGHMAAQD
jgi:hypothetical protein